MNILLEQVGLMQKEIKELKSARETQKITNIELDEQVTFLNELQELSFNSSDDDGVKINLYSTLEYENFNDTASIFDARNVEFFIRGRIGERLHGGAEIEFERTAKTSGGPRSGEVEVEQGWLQYDINNMINPRAGVILVPFGKFNLQHFDVTRDLTERPLMARRVVPTTWAEAGIGSVGQWSTKRYGRFDYQAYLINGLSSDVSDRGLRSARGAFGSDNNNNKSFVGRLGYNIDRTEVGVSSYWGGYSDQSDAIKGMDIDWEFKFGELEFIGEIAHFSLEKGVTADGFVAPRQLDGAYLQMNKHFWFESLNNTFLGADFPAATFTGVLRYDRVNIDDDGDMGFGDNEEKRWTVGLNYRPVESFVIKCEYQWNKVSNEILEHGNNNGVICSAAGVF